MFCYKDMTFCPFYEGCADADDCDRKLTPEVIKAAGEWMENAPIAQYMDEPPCFIRKETDE